MIEIPKDTVESRISPFQEEVVLENYFAGDSRAQLLAHLQQGLEEGRPLLVLTGEEGSGKTMLCRLLESYQSATRTNVLISWSVDSFEDIIRIISMKLGLDAVIDQDGGNVDQVLEQIIELLLTESVDLFLIFDEAENIYLATLERIRKMLDRVIDSGATMQILFCGRDIFLENFDQLSICDFQNNDSLLLSLQPLSLEETGDYLQDCQKRLEESESKTIFTKELVNEIYSMAQGNFRMTNILAEESVRNQGDDTSFMVLLGNVKDVPEKQVERQGLQHYRELLKRGVPFLPWIGGGLCCLLILLLFFTGGQEKENPAQKEELSGAQDNQEIVIVTTSPKGKIIDPKQLDSQTMSQGEPETKIDKATTAITEKLDHVTVEETGIVKTTEMIEQQNGQEIPLDASGPAQISVQKLIEDEHLAEKMVGDGDKVEADVSVSKGVIIGTVHNENIESSPNVLKVVKEEVKVVQLPSQQAKKKIKLISAQKVKSTLKKPRPQEVESSVSPLVTSVVKQLYSDRLSAGARWRKKDTSGLYTVQLMVLAAKGAEDNLQEMLAQVNYRQEAGNFYIFNKPTSPESLFVFYGEYSSIEMARLVKDSLPKFLRDHKPYALSIEKAVAKATE